MKIEKNEGNTDRIVRVFITLALFAAAIFFVEGTARVFCIILGTTMTITTALGWCPLYLLFGVNTCGK
jgi:hypothetical protein